MSQQINPVSVKDVVLDLKSEIDYAVVRSGQNISTQRYPATSSSSSQHVYSLQIPSVSTIVSRNLQWGSTIAITVQGLVQPGEFLVNFEALNQANNGVILQNGDCLAAFPLSSLCTNLTCQINNTSVNVQLNRVLGPILRAVDRSEFEQFNGSSPNQLDVYGDAEDALPNRTFNAAAQVLNADYRITQYPGRNRFNSPFNDYPNMNCNNARTSRNSFPVSVDAGNTISNAADQQKTVIITFSVVEPVFLSPFLYGESSAPGISGSTQLNFTCNMDSLATRAINWVLSNTAGSTKYVTNVAYTDAFMEATYYTPKSSDLIPAVIITPLMNLTNHQLPSQGILAEDAVTSVTSNSIMLNSYPDKVIIWIDDTNKYDSQNGTGNQLLDVFSTIEKVDITLNNQSGILSTYSPVDLFRASVQSGSKQLFSEFRGLQNERNVYETPKLPTCGSILMLDFGTVIPIPQDYLAAGSLATAQFQITVTFKNNNAYSVMPQLNTLMVYSGILSTSNGSSSSYTSGVLTKQNVLDASTSSALTTKQLKRYVGAGWLDSLKSIAKTVLPMAKGALSGMDNKYAKLGANVLDTVGYGKKSNLLSKLY